MEVAWKEKEIRIRERKDAGERDTDTMDSGLEYKMDKGAYEGKEEKTEIYFLASFISEAMEGDKTGS